ncbi:hypothetical protein [Zoogloea sp.]|uniref:hypothetical protein n=1 Tax=Zoogloea sp. TaxID=49181 RepID=UPI001415D7EC|nr:MAG: hypothetical protein F9K15_12735 [Zoogloea sp.]
METIRPIQPDGFKQIPQKPKAEETLPAVPEVQPVPVDVNVGWFRLITLWLKTNLAEDIINFFKGAPMESKLWYTSKVLWTNLITLLWTFLGPMIGIPVLDPEIVVAILGVINLVLRIITKSPVTLK